MSKPDRCHVNQILGGGIFVCHRSVATSNGFCEFHGGQTAQTLDLELTWREWFKMWFFRIPYGGVRRFLRFPHDIRFWWRTRKNPPCAYCRNRSMITEHGKRVCFDHYGP